MKTVLIAIMTALGALLILASIVLFILKAAAIGIGPDLAWAQILVPVLSGVVVGAVGSRMAYTSAKKQHDDFVDKHFGGDFFKGHR